jgi:glycosyltransferase involved in cell wall biosynthesis
MKILYVDDQVKGHHYEYMRRLVLSDEHDSVVILPERVKLPSKIKQIKYNQDIEIINPIGYIRLLLLIKKVSKQEKIDVIHFLSFDPLLKYFGLFLSTLRNNSIIVTFHHIRYSKLHDFARKRVLSCCKYCVVHTKHLEDFLKLKGFKNCEQIEYPVFTSYSKTEIADAKQYWNISPGKAKVLLSLGGTRFSKGLDILLDALSGISDPFYLIVAGEEDYFDIRLIKDKIANYKEKVFLKLSYLTEIEVKTAISLSDIVVLPYRKVFDGASGPLGEGVVQEKCIVGPKHGSLGDLVTRNHLGYVFEAEDVESLRAVLKMAINSNFTISTNYLEYKKALSPYAFASKYEKIYKQ